MLAAAIGRPRWEGCLHEFYIAEGANEAWNANKTVSFRSWTVFQFRIVSEVVRHWIFTAISTSSRPIDWRKLRYDCMQDGKVIHVFLGSSQRGRTITETRRVGRLVALVQYYKPVKRVQGQTSSLARSIPSNLSYVSEGIPFSFSHVAKSSASLLSKSLAASRSISPTHRALLTRIDYR